MYLRHVSKEFTKGRPVTPGGIIGCVKVWWPNDIGAVSVQLTLRETQRWNNPNKTHDRLQTNNGK